MTEFIYITFLLFLAVLIETLIGSLGIIIPFTALLIFYISITYGWDLAVLCCLVAGLFIDINYGRSFFISPFSLSAIVILAMFWLYRGEAKSLALHVIPGALAGAFYFLPLILISIYLTNFSAGVFTQELSHLIFCTVVSAVLLPVLVIVLDCVAEIFDFEIYAKAKEKMAGWR